MKRVLVLTDTMPWGHRSIARAIYGFVKSREKELGVKVDYAEVKAETGIGGDIYTFAYRYFPVSNRIAHKLASRSTLRELFAETSEFNLPNLKKTVNKYKPDLIICSYFYHSHSLARWRDEAGMNFKLWTVIADPWTINPVSWISKADLSLVYDEIGIEEGKRYGIKEEKMLKTGWWVRPEMYQKHDRSKMHRKWGISDARPVIFVGGGSLGTNSLTKLLPVLLMVKTKLAVVFNSGTDKLGYSLVEEYAKMFKKMRRNDLVKIINLGWVENMAEVLGACDIVFGKAGPNFIFDVVACEKPLVAITHIGGQEDGNIELIRKKKLGWVKEKGLEAAEFLLDYVNSPEKFNDRYSVTIKEEAKRNEDSFRMIERELKKI